MKITTNRKGYDVVELEFGEALVVRMHVSENKTVEVRLDWLQVPNSGMVIINTSEVVYTSSHGGLFVSAEDIAPEEMTIQLQHYPLKLRKLWYKLKEEQQA